MFGKKTLRAGLFSLSFAVVTIAQPLPKNPIGVEGFQQLIPRGGIAAVVDPVFVDAASAEIPDNAWILGFAADGEAYAYDLNLLNSHEVVNHRVGRTAIAAVW